MSLTYTDIDARFFDRATGLRLAFNPRNLLGAEWELVENGGVGQITVRVGQAFETLGIPEGSSVELWVDGESSARVRGIVTAPESVLDTKEGHRVVAMGRMVDMDHCVVNKRPIWPGGRDIAYWAAQILSDYEQRRGLKFSRDIQQTGVAIEMLDMTNTTLKAAMDALFEQSGRQCVWGWDVDPDTGGDRFYVRPRQTGATGYQFWVGDNVRLINSPSEISGLRNALKIQGGPAKFPQLLTNPSFEVPQLPDANSGNLLDDGGFEADNSLGNTHPWQVAAGNPSIDTKDDGHGHLWVAHSGKQYVLLDKDTGTNDAISQIVTLPVGEALDANGYVCWLNFAGTDESAIYTGQVTIQGLKSDGTNTTDGPATASFSNEASTGLPGDLWSGGQPSTPLASDGFSVSTVFVDAATAKAKITISLTGSTGGSSHGLLIDDVVFARAGGFGQVGWGTHLRHTPDSNKFTWIDWGCLGAAWEGLYGVRCSVVATSSDRPCLAPIPQDNSGQSGYHFKPQPGQTLRVGFRVRMSPGLNSADGAVMLTYRGWKPNGRQAQVKYWNGGTLYTVDHTSTDWRFVYMDVTAHSDDATATIQIEFGATGIYDVDGFTARDLAGGEGPAGTNTTGTTVVQNTADLNYLSTADFEKYVTVEDSDIAPSLSTDAAASIETYGLQEGVLSNKDVVDWTVAAIAYIAAWFNRNAIPLKRPRIDLSHEADQVPTPGSGLQVQVSGLAQADIVEWPARVSYSFAASCLRVSIELTNERPTFAKLLKLISAPTSGSVSGIAATAQAAAESNGGGSGSGGSGGIDLTDGTTDLPDTVEIIVDPGDFAIADDGSETGQSTMALAATGVAAGTYAFFRAAIDAKGRVTAAQEPAVTTETGNYTLTANDDILLGNTAGGGFTITLPAAAGNGGRLYLIQNTGANTLTVGVTGADTVNGASSLALTALYDGIIVVSDNVSMWHVLSRTGAGGAVAGVPPDPNIYQMEHVSPDGVTRVYLYTGGYPTTDVSRYGLDFQYKHSLDNGATWVEGTGPFPTGFVYRYLLTSGTVMVAVRAANAVGESNWVSSANTVYSAPAAASDHKLDVSGSDTTPDYLLAKLSAGSNITLTRLNPGANEQVQIAAAGGVALSSTTPAAETFGAAGAVGTGTTAARADHVHAMPADNFSFWNYT